jgi:hypothetical protein
MGEDKGGGENPYPFSPFLTHFPPPLTPPTEGGELKGCHSSPCTARGILACFNKIKNVNYFMTS